MRHRPGPVTSAVLGLALVLGTAGPAAIADPDQDTSGGVHPAAAPEQPSSLGYEGYCLEKDGVSVVVDVKALGPRGADDGSPLVRCAPGVDGFSGTGLDALREAGVSATGVERWGMSFICRLQGRPAADETIPVRNNPGYRETCVDTPPAAAYWSYWHAGPAESGWTYSQRGVTAREALPGGFEGWSFSLNAGPTTNPAPRVPPVRPKAYRLSGSNRYATAREVSARYQVRPSTVFVGTGTGFADVLAGSALAGRSEVPVHIVRPDGVPASVAAELRRLNPGRIVVLGGSSAVHRETVDELAQIAPVERWSGTNRYATAERISREYPTSTSRVYIASGENFPDALAASAVAGVRGAPVLLTRPTSVPSETVSALRRLRPDQIIVVGGAGAVTDPVLDALKGYAPSVVRVSGSNRYATAAAASRYFSPGVDVAYLATGADYPDALSGSALAARTEGPVLLTAPGRLPAATAAELTRLRPAMVVVLGGTTSVSEDVRRQLETYVVRP